MLEGDDARIYTRLFTPDDATRRLWNTDTSRPTAPVVYRVRYWFRREATGGLFTPEGIKRISGPVIVLFRRPDHHGDEIDLASATLDELVTLAHERGHERSWNADTYRENDLKEEQQAWSHAEFFLRELGFAHWSDFHEHRDRSLENAERHCARSRAVEQVRPHTEQAVVLPTMDDYRALDDDDDVIR